MQNNKPIWFEEDKTTFANPDTYQTIKHNKVDLLIIRQVKNLQTKILTTLY